eukprot:11390009-Karenia_brevis.AAC.1
MSVLIWPAACWACAPMFFMFQSNRLAQFPNVVICKLSCCPFDMELPELLIFICDKHGVGVAGDCPDCFSIWHGHCQLGHDIHEL